MDSISQPVANVLLELEGLPLEIARQVELAQRDNPEILRRIVTYGMIRKTIFEALVAGAHGREA